jgi:FkbM family methyltransferase
VTTPWEDWVPRLQAFARQTDVRANPSRALARRVRWRVHWKVFPNRSFEIRTWTRGLSIGLPNTGSAAQIYYHTFSSRQVARVIADELSPGMHFLDVGAHVGEYSLLAASVVGESGRVTAIEPQPDLVSVIRRNARRNGLRNLSVCPIAVSDRSHLLPLATDRRSGGAWLARLPDHSGRLVQCVSLDSFLRGLSGPQVDLAKVDAGGNEAAVFMGARESLTAGVLPRLIYKLYHPEVVTRRFGHDGGTVIQLLRDLGYEQAALGTGLASVKSIAEVLDLFGPEWYSIPILARLRPGSHWGTPTHSWRQPSLTSRGRAASPAGLPRRGALVQDPL